MSDAILFPLYCFADSGLSVLPYLRDLGLAGHSLPEKRVISGDANRRRLRKAGERDWFV